jgi:hypothetical protein
MEYYLKSNPEEKERQELSNLLEEIGFELMGI